MNNGPVFIRALSRSGGTLFVTLLDAHPDIAMSYELYPGLLEMPEGEDSRILGNVINALRSGSNKQVLNNLPSRDLKTFVARCSRGGISNHELADLFEIHLRENRDFSTMDSRLIMIGRCCSLKMEKEGKTRWGLKCNNAYEDYARVWPDSCFLNLIRDGRDVLASQTHTGSFNKTPEALARGWVETIRKFKEKVNAKKIRGLEVMYHELVQNPESETKKVCAFVGVSYHESMLNFHKQDLTIYKSSHMSMNRITKPIDTKQIGRYRNDLSNEDIRKYYSLADETMRDYGFQSFEDWEVESKELRMPNFHLWNKIKNALRRCKA